MRQRLWTGTARGVAVMMVGSLGLWLPIAAHASEVVCPTANPMALTCNGVLATCVGTAQSETIIGTDGDDVIVGQGGDDTIKGKAGHDILCGD